ncbi:MAG: hypothetical protein UT82_C0012G0011 [Parcubacteria group bacterium GW2011_GWB1_40_14]|nr:MAG: hypothetical protein UT82_C0012G0011 [Parcubacteria group bacterium GW2011_GWB1_40_14]
MIIVPTREIINQTQTKADPNKRINPAVSRKETPNQFSICLRRSLAEKTQPRNFALFQARKTHTTSDMPIST